MRISRSNLNASREEELVTTHNVSQLSITKASKDGFFVEDVFHKNASWWYGLKSYSHRGTSLDFTRENLGCYNQSHFALCGAAKCFYSLVSTKDQEFGYLVSDYYRKNAKHFVRNKKISDHLVREYGIKPLLIGPPEVLEVSKELVEGCLLPKRQKATEQDSGFFPELRFDRSLPPPPPQENSTSMTLIIQKSRRVKYPHLLFKCIKPLVHTLYINFDNYWEGVSNWTKYRLNLQESSAMAKHILHREDYLLDDFQVLIDQEGRFDYIDLGHLADKGFDPNKVRKYSSTTEKHLTCATLFDEFFLFVQKREEEETKK